MEKKLISVVIPVFNHAAALSASLSTLARQTYRPLEAVIVDDGSTDDFAAHISEYRSILESAGINCAIISQQNQGAPTARNRGIAESTGEFVICWDADTIAEPDMIEKLHAALALHPAAAFSYSRFFFGFKRMMSAPFDPALLRKTNYIDTTSLVRRSDMVLFDPTLKRFQDWDIWLTLAEKGKSGVFVPEFLFKKIVRGRKGYSRWFPSFFLRLPWKTARVRAYLAARERIALKHHLA